MQKMKRIVSMIAVICLLLSVLPMSVLAVDISPKPENGTTEGQPFAPGTGGSTNFRIPGIVTLDNGTLIAACDARWNHSGDGAGLDTIVSVSTDNGENWTYTFANYFGDNGNTYNNLSTCIIDPGIGTDGETAYLIADLWPAGIALNTSKYGPIAGKTGYTADGNLMLRDLAGDTVAIGGNGYNTMAASREYNYYLDLETLELCNADGTPVEGYTVDAYFNIKGEGVDTNLFFADSPYQPYPTDYLYMTTTTDGLNWSEPTLLNLKEAAEQTLLVGPGNGTYHEANGHMVFTAYEHTSGYERTSLIWMDAQGNWKRSEDCTVNNWSSEASAVVLDDGTVRVFYRDGYKVVRYTDMVWSEDAQNYVRDAAATEVNTVAVKDSGCQLTAIMYSEQIEGKDAIFLATPAGSARRTDGRIYVFLVNGDKSLELAYSYDIVPGQNEAYAYSCLTELGNGDLALLWEGDNPDTNGGAEIIFSVIPYADIIKRDNDPNLTIKAFELLDGYSKTFTDNTGCYVNADTSELDSAVAVVELTGEETTTNAAQVLGTGSNIDLDSCQYTFTAIEGGYYEVSAAAADGTTVYLNHYSTPSNNIPNVTAPAGKIAVLTSSFENMFKLQAQITEGGSGAARGLHFHMEADRPYWNRCGNDTSMKCHEYLFRKAAAGETASAEIPGYVMITSADQIVSGGKYLIAARNDAGNWYVLNPSTSTATYDHVAQIMGSTTVGSTELTFTGVGAGYTEVVIGSTLYKITVYDVNEVDVSLTVGGTATVTESSGNYADADVTGLDQTIATVSMTGVDGTAANGLSLEPVSSLVEGGKYVLVNTRANMLLTNGSATNQSAVGLLLDGTVRNETVDAAALWTYTAVDGGHGFADQDGKYLTVGSSSAAVIDTATALTINYTDGIWNIGLNGQYLNQFGGSGSTCAAGYGVLPDGGSNFNIYTYTAEPHGPSTEITFTGVALGTTQVLIGRTLYKITVSEGAAHVHEWSDWTTTATCTEAGVETRSCACGETETRDAAALGHDYVAHEVVPPTCTKTGYTVYKCTRCDKTYKDDPVEPEHKWDSGTVTAPTCTDQGYTTLTCTVCGQKYVDEATWTDALGHDFVNGDCTRCDAVKESTFEDVPAGQFYFDPVEWAVENGITTGATATTFNPNGECQRAQVVTFLWRAAGSPEPTSAVNPFTDVKEGDFFYKAVLWAVENGITNGISATEFGPFALCNRAQVVTFLWRAMGSPDSSAEVSFTDVADGQFYTTAVAWAVENGVTNGMGDGTFGIGTTCNRAQVVTFLYRTYVK